MLQSFILAMGHILSYTLTELQRNPRGGATIDRTLTCSSDHDICTMHSHARQHTVWTPHPPISVSHSHRHRHSSFIKVPPPPPPSSPWVDQCPSVITSFPWSYWPYPRVRNNAAYIDIYIYIERERESWKQQRQYAVFISSIITSTCLLWLEVTVIFVLFTPSCAMSQYMGTHSVHHFPAPSSKLCQIWLHHWRDTLYHCAAVHQRCQRPPKGLGTNETGSNIAPKHPCKHKTDASTPSKKEKEKRFPRFRWSWFYLCCCKQHGQI